MATVKIIVLIIIFLVITYFFLFRRTKMRKNQDFDSVKEYHENYLNHKSRITSGYEYRIHNDNARTGMYLSGDTGTGRNNTVTKYNSTEDYREK